MLQTEKIVEPGKTEISRLGLEKLILMIDDKIEKLSYSSEESFYYITNGYGLLEVDSYGYALEPQLSIYMPPKTLHSFQNTGESELILLRYSANKNR
ncbi:hypothetical protein ES705_03393 [subsurface metagenome]